MSTGKLKAQYNRVRTSTALHTTSIWSNTIGLQQEQAGTNQAIEAQIYAPGGGGGGRAAKRQRAQELIEATGFQPSVRDFEGLKALARKQGGDAATNRGACKICGGLGHLTKQCRNFLDNGNKGAAGATAGAAAGDGERQLLTADDDDALLLESDSDVNSSDLGSDSGTDNSRDRKRRKKEKKEKSRKHKKEKSKKHKKEKSRKHKSRDRSRSRSRSRSRDRTGRDRSRSRSPARRY